MGGHSLPLSSLTKKNSNFECLLNSFTPSVPLKRIPENCVENFNREWNPSGNPISEYFLLRDAWGWFEEWSAYGRGTEVTLKDGDKVFQYFTPSVSAIQISINKRIQKVDSLGNGCQNATESWSDGSKGYELFRSSSNSSASSKFWDYSSGDSSTNHEHKGACLFNRHFEFHDIQNPYTRAPFYEKIQILAQENPGLMTLRSTDLLPSSWMAVACYRSSYHIPEKVGVKELSAAFITFHSLSSFHRDTSTVDPAHEKNRIEGLKEMMNKNRKETKIGHPRMALPPFGLAALYLRGDVWLSNGESDKKRFYDLNEAANSWIKQRHFYHNDFNFFANRSHIRA